MFLRALLLLSLLIGISIVLSLSFGDQILLALGLVLTQIKLLWKSVATIEWPAILGWLKTQAGLFLRIELIKKWMMTTILPLAMGSVLRRRISRFFTRYKAEVSRHYLRMNAWYEALALHEKIVATLIVVVAMLGLSVGTLGLWLVLFTIQLPFWLGAAFAALAKMTWQSISKTAFKMLAFFQLGILWRLLRRRLPESYLENKRRLDFRVARMVVRQRRLTVRELNRRKESLGLRWAVWRAQRKATTEARRASSKT